MVRKGLQRFTQVVQETAQAERETCPRYMQDYRACQLRLFRWDRHCFSLHCAVCGRYSEHDAPDMTSLD